MNNKTLSNKSTTLTFKKLVVDVRYRLGLLLLIALASPLLSCTAAAQPAKKFVVDAIDLVNTGNLKQSINILQQGLEQHPENSRIKLELASNYYSNKEYRLARNYAKKVLDDDSIPTIVRSNVNRFIKKINTAEQYDGETSYTRRHSLRVFAGHDSNANIAPANTTIDIGELDKSFIGRAEDFNGLMYDFSQYKPVRLSDSSTQRNSPSPRDASLYHYSGFTLYNKNYSSFDKNDLFYASARAGLQYKSSSDWYFKAKLSGHYIELDKSSLLDLYKLDLQVGHYFGATELGVKLTSKYKDYHHQNNEKNQGSHFVQTLVTRHRFSNGMSLSLNLSNVDASLKDQSYSYDAKEVETSFHAPITSDISINLSSHYSSSGYRGIQRHYTDNRDDSLYTHNLRLNVDDIYHGLGVEVSYSYYSRESNHEINAYDRNIALLTLKYPFGH